LATEWIKARRLAMKLSSSVSYAIGILLQVHVKGEVGPTTAATIAAGCKFPPRFLYRILRRLVDAGLLTGISGPGGGYALARKPRRISLLDVVKAVEGPLETSQLTPVCQTHRAAMRLVNRTSAVIGRQTARELRKATLDKLIRLLPAAKAKARSKGRRKRRSS
jgi:Rrf2 family protein